MNRFSVFTDPGNLLETHEFLRKLNAPQDDSLVNSLKSQCECISVSSRLNCARDLLLVFYRLNWLGPINDENCDWLMALRSQFACTQNQLLDSLGASGETLYPLTCQPILLLIARVLLLEIQTDQDCNDQCTIDEATKLVWSLRCIHMWNAFLDEPTAYLASLFQNVFNKLAPYLEENDCDENDSDASLDKLTSAEQAVLLCESAALSASFHKHVEQKTFVKAALETVGLKYSFSGALGKNTKFQKDDSVNLFLKVETIDYCNLPSDPVLTQDDLPVDRALEDDTLLPTTVFTSPEEVALQPLSAHHQTVLCASLLLQMRSRARETVTDVERKAFIQGLLTQPLSCAVQFWSLFQRSILEKEKMRYLERSLMQIELLWDYITSNKLDLSKKGYLSLSVPLPSRFQLLGERAKIHISIGNTASALEIFEQLEMWEDAISCLNSLGRRTVAEDLIKKRLDADPTPRLWCLYGDACEDPAHYLKALDLSNGKSARALRSLGFYYIGNKDWGKAIEYLSRAVKVNHIHIGAWYSLGCAAMISEKYELAAKAFQNYCALLPDNGEAWSNLAVCFIRLGHKVRAHRALTEALRGDYNNWRIWENMLYTSLDIKHFVDAIRSMRNIAHNRPDLKEVDPDALKVLTHSVINDTPDLHGFGARKYHKNLLELFGFLTSQISSYAPLWRCYGKLCYELGNTFDEKSKGFDYFVKGLRLDLQSPKLDKDFTFYINVCVEATGVIELGIQLLTENINCKPLKHQLEGCCLNIQNLQQIFTKTFVDDEISKEHRDTVDGLEHIKLKLQSVIK